MKVLVTGATGYIGVNLVLHLVSVGYRVRVFRRPSSSVQALDGTAFEDRLGSLWDDATLSEAMQGCDGVVHLAGTFSLWPRDFQRLYATNVLGTARTLAAARRASVARFVHVSSAGAIGLTTAPVVLDELAQDQFDPHKMPYHATKLFAEREVLRAAAAGLPAVIVNPTIVIGRRDYGLKNPLFRSLLRSPVHFTAAGGGNVVSVTAAVDGIVRALERGRPGERYILGGENLPYRNQADLIMAIAGRRAVQVNLDCVAGKLLARAAALVQPIMPVSSFLSPHFLRISRMWAYYSSTKAQAELGYRSSSYREAVDEALAWYREAGLVRPRPSS